MRMRLDEHNQIPISERDALLVRTVYSYRFLTSEQAARLFSWSEQLSNLYLGQLAETGYLAAIKRPTLQPLTVQVVYALDQRGANLLASLSGVDRKQIRWRKYHNQVKLLFLEHRLAVNDFRIALVLGAPRGPYGIEKWIYEPVIREWSVDDPDELAPPLALRPDAYTAVTAGPRRLHFFVEVDMGTESHAHFASKIRRYLAFKESRLFPARFGGRSFRILTVAPTKTRVASLKRVAEGVGGRRLFWFARLGGVIAGHLTATDWQLAGNERAGFSLFKGFAPSTLKT